jgi:hypothetical protein
MVDFQSAACVMLAWQHRALLYFISWRTVTSMSHHELVQRTMLDNQHRNDWHGINASNPGSIRMQTEIASFVMDCHGLHAAKDATAAFH